MNQAIGPRASADPGGGPPPHLPATYRLTGLTRTVTALAAVDAAAWLGSLAAPKLDVLGVLAAIAQLLVLVIWMYRARVNATWSGWHQRYSPRWAIWAWFVPVGNLYIPFRIVEDIWRAGGAPRWERGRSLLPRAWWACFLLEYFVTMPDASPVKVGPLIVDAGLPLAAKGGIAVAAAMTAVITGMTSRTWLGTPRPQGLV